MRKFLKLIFATCSVVFILVACQKTDFGSLMSSSGDEVSYNFIYDQADHLKDIIQDKDWKTADKLFAKHRQFFDDPDRKELIYEQLSVVAKGLNSDLSPKLTRSLYDLNNISMPPPVSEWATVFSKIKNARTVTNKYSKYSIINLTQFQSLEFKNLRSALIDTENFLRDNASIEFKLFNINDGNNFFDVYPFSIDATKFLATEEDIWNDKISNADASQLKLIYQAYSKILPEYLKEDFSNEFYRKTMSELSVSDTSTFENILTAIDRASTLGVPVMKVPDAKIAAS